MERRTHELKEAYEKIMSSIRYAGVLQNSLLPSMEETRSYLPESFFIWRPRDIVGGDIYTCDRVDGGILISVIDCTGHGVPGAFMTMLAGSAVRRIIREERITQPAVILKRLNRIIKAILQQDRVDSQSDDGLDAGICFYSEKEQTLYFAGAGLPLYVADETGLDVIKGDRQSIGYVSSDTGYAYTTHAVEVNGGSRTFYMVTDGYSDQLGGAKNKRFGSGSFKQLLAESRGKSLEDQAGIFLSALERHKGDNPQTDDVTMAGFRITTPLS